MSVTIAERQRRTALAKEVLTAGGTLQDLARRLGKGEGTARAVCYDARITLPSASRQDNAQKRARVLELARDGIACPEICAQVGVSPSSVLSWASKAGVSMRKARGVQTGTASFDVIAEVFHNPGATDTDVARATGCTRERVGQVRAWMRDKGIKKL